MHRLKEILKNNKRWVKRMQARDPQYFEELSAGQDPEYLFIGCADSRVPAGTITGTHPGEMFVHRNIANQVFSGDLNLLSVLQYAVEVLNVRHIIVCGHYGCGGIKAAQAKPSHGLVDYWLAQIRDINLSYADRLALLADPEQRTQRLVEMSVVQQVVNLARLPMVTQAWREKQGPSLNGVVYDLSEGRLRPLVLGVENRHQAEELCDLYQVVQSAVPGEEGPPADLSTLPQAVQLAHELANHLDEEPLEGATTAP